jgi:hypothetical protein
MPDGDHRALPRRTWPTARHPRWRERLNSVGLRAIRGGGRDPRCRGRPCRPARSARSWCAANGDARLLAEPGGHGQDDPRRLALDWRHGPHGRRRLCHDAGPVQRHDHLRRLQHLSPRGRGGVADPPRRARGGGGRPSRCRMGRGGGGLRGRAAGRAERPMDGRRWMRCASTASHGSSGRSIYRFVSMRCPRTITARS